METETNDNRPMEEASRPMPVLAAPPARPPELLSDLKKYTDNIAPPFGCRKCPRNFGTQQGVRMHYIRSHTSRNWDTTNNLKRRKNTRRQSARIAATARWVKQRSTVCPIPGCERKFADRHKMVMHVNATHGRSIREVEGKAKKKAPKTNGERHECPLCHFRFGSRGGMTSHLRFIHHRSIKDLEPSVYECPYCEFTTGMRAGFTRHMHQQHPGQTGLVEMRPTAPSHAERLPSLHKVEEILGQAKAPVGGLLEAVIERVAVIVAEKLLEKVK